MLTRLLANRREAVAAKALSSIEKTCVHLLSEAGSANTAALATMIMDAYAQLPKSSRIAFFNFLDQALRPDATQVLQAATAYAENSDAANVLALQRVVDPPRQELLRRINGAAGGTAAIIGMRRDLLNFLPHAPQLRAVDSDFRHLLSSWFNPGFLVLRQIDWNSPAVLLEEIIRQEAVHAIKDWSDLRRRLQPDRRCFAFFHPQLPDKPLIFVEVALVRSIPRAIDHLINDDLENSPVRDARVAAFYSISSCEPGLSGVSLGNFLIKRVAELLQVQVPTLRRFCTLSPVPSLRKWMTREPADDDANLARERAGGALASLRTRYGNNMEKLADLLPAGDVPIEDQRLLEKCAAIYLTRASVGAKGDPVARFHLSNGARLECININSDLSAKGLRDSFGVMVNYLYDINDLESNHWRFFNGDVVHSHKIGRICRRP